MTNYKHYGTKPRELVKVRHKGGSRAFSIWQHADVFEVNFASKWDIKKEFFHRFLEYGENYVCIDVFTSQKGALDFANAAFDTDAKPTTITWWRGYLEMDYTHKLVLYRYSTQSATELLEELCNEHTLQIRVRNEETKGATDYITCLVYTMAGKEGLLELEGHKANLWGDPQQEEDDD